MAQTKAQLIDGKGDVDLGALSISGSAPDNSVNLDSSGRVGIGTTSPPNRFTTDITAPTSSYDGINLVRGSSATGFGLFFAGSSYSYGTGLASGDAWLYSSTQPISIMADGASSTIKFSTGGNSERARIDSSGRLLVGTSTAWDASTDSVLQLVATGASNPKILTFGRNSNSADAVLGNIEFYSASNVAARISAANDLAHGAGDGPGRLVFSTTADGASSSTERMRITNAGYTLFYNSPGVAPNTDNAVPLGLLSQRWSAVYAANGTIQTSDERTKTNVATSSLGCDFIKSLRPVSYKWLEGGNQDTGERDENGNYIYKPVPGKRTHWGFIAQEVKQAVDAAGVDFGGWVLTDKDDPDSQQALRYDQFIAPLTKALQEALAEIDVLKAKVAALESA